MCIYVNASVCIRSDLYLMHSALSTSEFVCRLWPAWLLVCLKRWTHLMLNTAVQNLLLRRWKMCVSVPLSLSLSLPLSLALWACGTLPLRNSDTNYNIRCVCVCVHVYVLVCVFLHFYVQQVLSVMLQLVSIYTYNYLQAGVTRLKCSNRSPLVFTACQDGCVRMWDVRGGECVREWWGHTRDILDLNITRYCIYITPSLQE